MMLPEATSKEVEKLPDDDLYLELRKVLQAAKAAEVARLIPSFKLAEKPLQTGQQYDQDQKPG